MGYRKDRFIVEAVIKRFGTSGRNSFRADFVVLDCSVHELSAKSSDEILRHAVILAEVKRDNADASKARAYQVAPMLDFSGRDDAVAVYWDDVEQRVFWQSRKSGVKTLRDGPLADLPTPGQKPGVRPLTYNTIDANKPLLDVFRRVEDILHSASIGPQRRFTIMLQLLLAKLYDEHQGQGRPNSPLALQDFRALSVDALEASEIVNELLRQAVRYYQTFLPAPVPARLDIDGGATTEVMRVLAPVKITAMQRSVIQDFYMYFARHIYKWDLAQYFTPTSLTEFIIELLNPRFSEHVKDPACGSADFLTAAFRRGQHWPDYSSSVWGSDVSSEAVQVAVLNMILNGDGKTNIREEDSLAKISANRESCDVVVCNPPFGAKIVERSKVTLSNFDLGHHWVRDQSGRWTPSKTVLNQQESGILFAEACVKLLRPGGRLAIILPNGYLGNRSDKYVVLREWLLRNTRLCAIVALPRFTFKSSGADVSASVVFCEKRDEPLGDANDSDWYEYAVEVVDRVGWMTGDKKGAPIYKRDTEDGTYLVDELGGLVIDSDFPEVISRIRASDAAQYFDWITAGQQAPLGMEPGWTVDIAGPIADPLRTLDPKRYCRKFVEVRQKIQDVPHFVLADVVDVLAERTTSNGRSACIEPAKMYRYVEIQDVDSGTFRWQERRGWELPQRARHHAEPADLYVGGIRNSVRKWFLVGQDCGDLLVTNGMHRLRVKPGEAHLLLDLVVGLCSEAYRVQMRGFARGADGLAEIWQDDLLAVVLPRILDKATRAEVEPFVRQLLIGATTIEAKVASIADRLPLSDAPRQPDHTALL